MMAWSRRTTLGTLAGFTALSAFGVASPLSAATRRLPNGPMRLQRRLVRELHDGNQIVVERDWLVRFAARAHGIEISGHQVHARVSAPKQISAIAAVEERRSTSGLFPILLDAQGFILSVGRSTDRQDVEAALSAAEQVIVQAGSSAGALAAHREVLARLQQAGSSAFGQLPRDLFFPGDAGVSERREFALPGGSVGQFEIAYHARRTAGGDWLDIAERRITTRLGGTERRSSESWRLSAG